MKVIKLIMFFGVFIFLNSCMLRQTALKTVDCPIPVQNCSPTKWSGLKLDTSVNAATINGYYYSISAVNKLNTNLDEWQITFINNRKAILTLSEGDIQKIQLTRVLNPNTFTIESGINNDFDGHYGSTSYLNGNLYISNSKNLDIKSNNSDIIKEDLSNTFGISKIYHTKLSENNLRIQKEIISKNAPLLDWYSHPSIAPNGDILFFTYDKDDGITGTDIYFSILMKDGNWSKPINCGDSINSQCDEITPFIDKEQNRIYFSSNGYDNVGGFDLFYANINPKFWDIKDTTNLNPNLYFSSPKNLRVPINTIYDEIYPSSPNNCDTLLYYSSNQNQTNGFDIYVKYRRYLSDWDKGKIVEHKNDIKIDYNIDTIQKDIKIDFNPYFKLKGTIYQKETNLPLKESSVHIFDTQKEHKIKVVNADEKGNYEVDLSKSVEYNVTAQNSNLFYDSENIIVDLLDTTKTIRKDFYIPVSLTLRINFPLNEYNNPYKNILDSNGIETSRKWEEELDLVAANIKISMDKLALIELTGHTDDLSSDEYNIALGERRVNFIVDELVKRGIPKEILKVRSAGEREPLPKIENENINMYRKRLRRVTMEKIFKK